MSKSLKITLALLLLACSSHAFSRVGVLDVHMMPHVRSSRNARTNCRMTINIENENTSDLKNFLEGKDYPAAFQVLKRNPMMHIDPEDGRVLMNNIEALSPNTNNQDADQKAVLEAASFLYKRLERQHVIRGFGCIDGEYPEKGAEVSPARLEEVTGISTNALTPKERTTYWRLAGVALCIAEYFLGDAIGVDPLFTLIPGTFAIFALDQLAYKGAGFETIYQGIFPEYKQKIICHEAGHFLISYLLGVPVRGCVTNAMDARKYPDIKGQAGTIFYDPKLAEEIAATKVTRSSLDRISVITMAGIAAEALKFGRAEGGAVDEQALIGFLTSVSPPWNILRVQGQARWAAMQSILLIREHVAAYDALVAALAEGKGVGDCVEAIEKNLPAVLPSVQRVEDRKQKKKAQDAEMLMRYIQKMTWRVGGVLGSEYDGNVMKGPNPHEIGESDGEIVSAGQAVVGLDGYIIGAKKEAVNGNAGGTFTPEPEGKDDVVTAFTERIRKLEKAAESGVLNIADKNEGGIWLNSLTSLKPGSSTTASNVSSGPNIAEGGSSSSVGAAAAGGAFDSEVVIPPPLEGYEERVEELAKRDGILKESGEVADVYSPRAMLSTHRGYQLKRLENISAGYQHKAAEIEGKMAKLRSVVQTRESSSSMK